MPSGPKASSTNSSNFSVNSFSELLDVRDNLRVPIMFYIVSPHIKSKFYIKYGDDLYLLTIKAVDLEK